MLGKLIISTFINSAAKAKAAQQNEEGLSMAKMFLQYLKSLKKTGVKLRESMLLNGDGKVIVRDSGVVCSLTTKDIMTIHNILVHGDECRDVLHLDGLYYCVKELTDRRMVLFNGTYYIIACLTKSGHVVLFSLRAKKSDGTRVLTWIQGIADGMRSSGRLGGSTAYQRQSRENILDWF